LTTEAAPAEFYDDALTSAGALAMVPAEESPWYPIYREVAGWLYGSEPIVDLGSGTGRFATVAAREGHSGSYTGFDFSPAAVDEATRYLAYTVPDYEATFEVLDLRDWQPDEIRAGATTYVCLEVLEHLDDDLALIATVPAGHRLLFSVPNYGSKSHVRRFNAAGDVWERYSALLQIRRWTLIETGTNGHAIHVVDAQRRMDSWS
jgi:SAM-dependent methyltransferase